MHIVQKDFLQEMIKIIGPKNDPPQIVQEKVLSLIQVGGLVMFSLIQVGGLVMFSLIQVGGLVMFSLSLIEVGGLVGRWPSNV